MYALLTLTLMHDRSLSAAPDSNLSPAEVSQWNRSIALFNNKLSGPVQPRERDALWATTILLGTIAFHPVDARSPEKSWPLKPPSSMDLNWLSMIDGKESVGRIAQPWRDDSIFQAMFLANLKLHAPPDLSTVPELHSLPPELVQICEIDERFNGDINPYYCATSTLAQSMNSDSVETAVLGFLIFVSHMPQDYKHLLEQKDPRALLLFAYWYARICPFPLWWIQLRATIECQAICMYLEKHHPQEPKIQGLLRYPRAMCGLAEVTN